MNVEDDIVKWLGLEQPIRTDYRFQRIKRLTFSQQSKESV
ncbi:protein of unknown function [Candidatus Nitrosocosmicus franklandus]|uniref:Uncharacterized protein n=1 Tax=Candidatus Nitrosocosmicus franklandianus TaxID=1798806 RepID=A0A484IFR4_9ARCH|nr:protein of unknown function [Candidatus Nitrosocosmicus franklandus]